MIIRIKDLAFKTIIGVLEFERTIPQKVIINLEAKYDYKDGNYIDYVKLRDIIKTTMQEQKFELLEDALEFITKEIISKYQNIRELQIEISKPDILQDCVVSLSKRVVNSSL